MDGWKSLLTARNQIEAEVIKSYLESRGIKVILQGEAAGHVYGLSTGPLAEVQVLVPVEQHLDAVKIMEEYEDDAY